MKTELDECQIALRNINLELLTDPNNKELRLKRIDLELLANSLTKKLFTMTNSIESSNPRKDESKTRLGSTGAPGQENLDDNNYIAGSRGEYDLESLALESARAEAQAKTAKAAFEAAKKLVLLKGSPIIKAKPIIVNTEPQASYSPLTAAERKVRKDIKL